jgi:hypothetical protein
MVTYSIKVMTIFIAFLIGVLVGAFFMFGACASWYLRRPQEIARYSLSWIVQHPTLKWQIAREVLPLCLLDEKTECLYIIGSHIGLKNIEIRFVLDPNTGNVHLKEIREQ